MILRKPEISDAVLIWEFLNKHGLNINVNSVLNNITNENESIIKIDSKVKGVILAKALPNTQETSSRGAGTKVPRMIEIKAWGGKREDRSLFEELFNKSRGKGYRRVGVMENEKSGKRIKILEEMGFKVMRKQEGIFPKNKAVFLRRRV